MAAVVRAQVASGSSGVKAALIAFVALTVVSLGAFVYLFTQHSDLENRTTSAEQRAAQAEEKAKQANDTLRYIAKEAAGVTSEDPAAIQQAVTGARGALIQQGIKGIDPSDALTSALEKMLAQYQNLSKQLADATKEREDLNTQLKVANEKAQTAQAAYQKDVDKLKSDYSGLESQFATAREGWNNDVAELRKSLAAATDTAGQSLSTERQAVKSLQQQIADRNARIEELRQTLASFRPSADQTAPIQIADGSVVRIVPGQGIAYIGLGSRDRIRPGMNFAVYSRHRAIPADGKGKATLEVTHVFDTTSECKVTSTTPAEPIVEGDYVANPVYDKNRQFSFVVAGDFDLNYDGTIDDVGGQEVARLIEAWGGKVVKTVDTRTDFVVLGASPAVTVAGPTPEAATAAEHAAEVDATRKAFDSISTEAKSLGIPVLTRTQFLHFIGRPVPPNAADRGT